MKENLLTKERVMEIKNDLPDATTAELKQLCSMSKSFLDLNDQTIANVDWLDGLRRADGGGTLHMMTIRVVGDEIRLVCGDHIAEKPLTKGAVRKFAESLNIRLLEPL